MTPPPETTRGSHTPGPWTAACGDWGLGQVQEWQIRKHEFANAPYEGDLSNEWGVYPPLGETGPVALVAGEANARLIAAAPAMLDALEAVNDPIGYCRRTGQDSFEQDWLVRKIRAALAAAQVGEEERNGQ